jgi:hypothetical protein
MVEMFGHAGSFPTTYDLSRLAARLGGMPRLRAIDRTAEMTEVFSRSSQLWHRSGRCGAGRVGRHRSVDLYRIGAVNITAILRPTQFRRDNLPPPVWTIRCRLRDAIYGSNDKAVMMKLSGASARIYQRE